MRQPKALETWARMRADNSPWVRLDDAIRRRKVVLLVVWTGFLTSGAVALMISLTDGPARPVAVGGVIGFGLIVIAFLRDLGSDPRRAFHKLTSWGYWLVMACTLVPIGILIAVFIDRAMR